MKTSALRAWLRAEHARENRDHYAKWQRETNLLESCGLHRDDDRFNRTYNTFDGVMFEMYRRMRALIAPWN